MVAPDGMYMDVSRPFPGSRHDSLILAESNLNNRLAEIQITDHVQYTFYADKGYPVELSHGRGAFRETEWMLPNQRQENKMMSPLRSTASEFGFAKPSNIMRYCDYDKNQKVQKSWVAKNYLVGLLICNVHSCLYGNTTSSYFAIDPPSLDNYFHVNVNN